MKLEKFDAIEFEAAKTSFAAFALDPARAVAGQLWWRLPSLSGKDARPAQ